MIPLSYMMSLSAIIFAIGVAGVIIRRNILVMYMSIDESAVGLGIIISSFRNRDTVHADDLTLMRW
jgi:NADH-quinone oxidoreductase subunit K